MDDIIGSIIIIGFPPYYIMVDAGNLRLLGFEISVGLKIVEDRRHEEVIRLKNINLT